MYIFIFLRKCRYKNVRNCLKFLTFFGVFRCLGNSFDVYAQGKQCADLFRYFVQTGHSDAAIRNYYAAFLREHVFVSEKSTAYFQRLRAQAYSSSTAQTIPSQGLKVEKVELRYELGEMTLVFNFFSWQS